MTIHEASQHHFRVEHISILIFFFTLKLLLPTGESTDLGKPKGWASLLAAPWHCHMILLPYGPTAEMCLILVAVCHRL